MTCGNAALLCLGILIARGPKWTMTSKDAAFGAIVVFIVAMRYLDVSCFGGTTSEGAPATTRDVLRHACLLAGVAGLGWVVAQSVHLG